MKNKFIISVLIGMLLSFSPNFCPVEVRIRIPEPIYYSAMLGAAGACTYGMYRGTRALWAAFLKKPIGYGAGLLKEQAESFIKENPKAPFYAAVGTGLALATYCLASTCKNLINKPNIEQKLPIVYHENYNISFGVLNYLHSFDGKKYGAIAQHLRNNCALTSEQMHTPEMVTDDQLRLVHTANYLESLKNSNTVAKIMCVPPIKVLPNWLLQRYLLNKMRYAVTGTIKAVELALEQGWSVNLSGGYHHAKSDSGEGFCVFADIPLAIKKARETRPALKVLVVDLDAHQGNGVEMILGDDTLTKTFDVYSDKNYPGNYDDTRKYITYSYPVKSFITTDEYLSLVKLELSKAIAADKPDLIIYNAGTDIFERDPLGRMSVAESGIIERDAFVFQLARDNKIPVAMVLSGGYTSESARIIGTSLENIIKTIVPTISKPATQL